MMIFHGLKTNIVIHLVVILVVGMFLIDFIVLISAQQLLLASATSKGQTAISLISKIAARQFNGPSKNEGPPDLSVVDFLSPHEDVQCLVLLGLDLLPLLPSAGQCPVSSELKKAVVHTIHTGEKVKRYYGDTWGVFWKQKRWVILTSPIMGKNQVAGGVGLLMSLESIYQQLKRMQGFIFFYIVVNTVLLTCVGLWGLSRVTIKPLQRLVKRADEYKDEAELPFLFQKDTSEFSRLSNSLNQMLKRISEDKVKLQATIESLEQANMDLREAQQDVVRAEKLATVGRLSSGLAHEIGNPIGIVLGYLELLKQENLSKEEMGEYIHRSETEVNRINGIIGQLLEFSRTSPVVFHPISIHQIIDEVRQIFDVQPFMENLQLHLTLTAKEDTVLADSEQLRQVFLNLMINAADAIASLEDPSSGNLTIITDNILNPDGFSGKEKKEMRIRFVDDGPGIEKIHLGNIFDPFFTTKEPGKGTGLGLSISYGIIQDIGGRIEASRKSSQGATITIFIPVYENEAK